VQHGIEAWDRKVNLRLQSRRKRVEIHQTSTRYKIAFGLTKIDGKDAYFIRDNSAGSIWQMQNDCLTRSSDFILHSESEFSGFGIGLATVQSHPFSWWPDMGRELGGQGSDVLFYVRLTSNVRIECIDRFDIAICTRAAEIMDIRMELPCMLYR
jgi:hypothetical protein